MKRWSEQTHDASVTSKQQQHTIPSPLRAAAGRSTEDMRTHHVNVPRHPEQLPKIRVQLLFALRGHLLHLRATDHHVFRKSETSTRPRFRLQIKSCCEKQWFGPKKQWFGRRFRGGAGLVTDSASCRCISSKRRERVYTTYSAQL